MENKIELDGKYTVILSEDGSSFKALRNGEPWRDLTGDNLIYYMFLRILDLEKEKLNRIREININLDY